MSTGTQAGARYAEVFGLAEFRALWLSQVLSVTGDQLARVALTVLVYDRTRSALLAAVTFAASMVPTFAGGVLLGGLADRLPRRQVMVGCDLVSGVLVAAMLVPGMPLAALIVLLAAVTMVGAMFLAARSATLAEVLDGDRYALGGAVTVTTSMTAQVVGFGVGGLVVAFLGVRVSLLADAATFAASAVILRGWVRARPAPARPAPGVAQQPGQLPAPAKPQAPGQFQRILADQAAGARLVFASPAMRIPMLFGWLCAFYGVPEGIAAPLAAAVGGSTPTVGLILAAQALGSAVGVLGFSRVASPAQRRKWTRPLAIATCASLLLFAVRPSLPATLLILAVSGLLACYQIAANQAFVRATPPARRSQAFGIAQGGISLGQGIAILLAGAAAEYVAPALVITLAGAGGTLCALVLTLTTTTGQHHYPGWRRRPDLGRTYPRTRSSRSAVHPQRSRGRPGWDWFS